jgi:hypothetical protein
MGDGGRYVGVGGGRCAFIGEATKKNGRRSYFNVKES